MTIDEILDRVGTVKPLTDERKKKLRRLCQVQKVDYEAAWARVPEHLKVNA